MGEGQSSVDIHIGKLLGILKDLKEKDSIMSVCVQFTQLAVFIISLIICPLSRTVKVV